jgi:hypothetical protein
MDRPVTRDGQDVTPGFRGMFGNHLSGSGTHPFVEAASSS